MSLATFKKKAINSLSSATRISGKPVDDYWIYAGPYGRPESLASVMLVRSLMSGGGAGAGLGATGRARNAGFSINGVYRNVKNLASQSRKFSYVSTPFRGAYPMGNGGTRGRYPSGADNVVLGIQPVLSEVATYTDFVAPSVLSQKGMLERRFRWAYNGQYPAYWVQPVYTGNQTESVSQGVYLQKKSAANDIWYDVNDTDLYVDYSRTCGSTGCQKTPARGYTMSIQQANAAYTKTLHKPKDASSYTLRIQQQCLNPEGAQKPFPYAVQTGTGVLRGGISVSSVASACNTSPTFVATPDWYLANRGRREVTGNQRLRDRMRKWAQERQGQVFADVVLNGTTSGGA